MLGSYAADCGRSRSGLRAGHWSGRNRGSARCGRLWMAPWPHRRSVRTPLGDRQTAKLSALTPRHLCSALTVMLPRKHKLSLAAASVLLPFLMAAGVRADVKLPALFSDNMVL